MNSFVLVLIFASIGLLHLRRSSNIIVRMVVCSQCMGFLSFLRDTIPKTDRNWRRCINQRFHYVLYKSESKQRKIKSSAAADARTSSTPRRRQRVRFLLSCGWLSVFSTQLTVWHWANVWPCLVADVGWPRWQTVVSQHPRRFGQRLARRHRADVARRWFADRPTSGQRWQFIIISENSWSGFGRQPDVGPMSACQPSADVLCL